MLFLDTSAIVAFRNRDDIHHDEARRVFENLARGEHGRGLITEYIVLETATVLKRRCGARVAIETGEALLNSEEIEVVSPGEMFDASWQEFVRLASTDLSFVDASSLVAMRRSGARWIATFDRAFRGIEGIEVVP